MVSNEMTLQEAIHLVSEEAVRCKRIADDLKEYPLDDEGRALDHARQYAQKAQALNMLVNIAKLWNKEAHK